MNQRKQEQLQHALRGAIQQVLARGLQDPRVRGLITITEVKVTTDRRQATVFVSIFPDDRADLTMHGLHDAEKHIRHEAGELIRTRVMPLLTFKRDERPKKDGAVLRAINLAAEADALAGRPPSTHTDADATTGEQSPADGATPRGVGQPGQEPRA